MLDNEALCYFELLVIAAQKPGYVFQITEPKECYELSDSFS